MSPRPAPVLPRSAPHAAKPAPLRHRFKLLRSWRRGPEPPTNAAWVRSRSRGGRRLMPRQRGTGGKLQGGDIPTAVRSWNRWRLVGVLLMGRELVVRVNSICRTSSLAATLRWEINGILAPSPSHENLPTPNYRSRCVTQIESCSPARCEKRGRTSFVVDGECVLLPALT